jgi:hypothetical protein
VRGDHQPKIAFSVRNHDAEESEDDVHVLLEGENKRDVRFVTSPNHLLPI